jgi:hypothetical protein
LSFRFQHIATKVLPDGVDKHHIRRPVNDAQPIQVAQAVTQIHQSRIALPPNARVSASTA